MPQDLAPIARDRTATLASAGLTLAALLFPLLGVFAPLGLTPLGILAALTCLPLVIRRQAWKNLPAAVLALPPALGLWALATTPWALDHHEALGGGAKLLFTGLQGLVLIAAAPLLAPAWRRRLGWALLGAATVAAVVLTAEYATDRGVSALIQQLKDQALVGVKSPMNRGATILALSGLAALALFRHHRPRWPLMVMAAALVAMFLGDSGSARLAVAAGLAAGIVALVLPRLAIGATAALVTAAWIALPIWANHIPDPQTTFQNWTFLSGSAHHRTTIWSFVSHHIAERPVLGWGMDAARVMPHGDDEVHLVRRDGAGNVVKVTDEPLLPLHPHNAILHVWLELGAVGAALAAALLLRVLWALYRLPPTERSGRAAALGGLVCAVLIASISYGAWQSWWQNALWLTATFFIIALRAVPAERV